MLIIFRKIGYSSIIPFVHEGKDEIHKYIQYEVSTTVCMGRATNQRKVAKWLPFKNYKSESLNIYVHIWGTSVHIYTKYKVSMSKPVPGGCVHR